MDWTNLTELAKIFGGLSLISVGGGTAILPDIFRQTVEVAHWLTASQFAAMFTIAQISPGPSMMIVPLIGWIAAGWSGALVAAAGMFIPSCLLVYFVSRLWSRFREAGWRPLLERALAPIALGLIFAGALTVVRAADHDNPAGYLVTAVTVALLVRTKINPLIPICIAGVLGAIGVI